MEIREAVDGDWAAIWPFFRDICRAGETYTYPRDLTEEQSRAYWMTKTVFVAVEDDRVLGSATIHPNQPGGGRHVANGSFMVDPAAGRRGIGRALGEHAIEQARQRGYRAMQFNAVVDTNTHAVRLWESLGFVTLCTVPEAFDHPVHGLVGLKVMHRRLVG